MDAADDEIIIPPPELKRLIDKTASFLAQHDPSMLDRLRTQKAADARFSFTKEFHPFFPYFEGRIKEFREAASSAPEGPVASAGDVGATAEGDEGTAAGSARRAAEVAVARGDPLLPSWPVSEPLAQRLPSESLDCIFAVAFAVTVLGYDQQILRSIVGLGRASGAVPAAAPFLCPTHALHPLYKSICTRLQRLSSVETVDAVKERLERWSDPAAVLADVAAAAAARVGAARHRAAAESSVTASVRANAMAKPSTISGAADPVAMETRNDAAAAGLAAVDWGSFTVVGTAASVKSAAQSHVAAKVPPNVPLSSEASVAVAVDPSGRSGAATLVVDTATGLSESVESAAKRIATEQRSAQWDADLAARAAKQATTNLVKDAAIGALLLSKPRDGAAAPTSGVTTMAALRAAAASSSIASGAGNSRLGVPPLLEQTRGRTRQAPMVSESVAAAPVSSSTVAGDKEIRSCTAAASSLQSVANIPPEETSQPSSAPSLGAMSRLPTPPGQPVNLVNPPVSAFTAAPVRISIPGVVGTGVSKSLPSASLSIPMPSVASAAPSEPSVQVPPRPSDGRICLAVIPPSNHEQLPFIVTVSSDITGEALREEIAAQTGLAATKITLMCRSKSNKIDHVETLLAQGLDHGSELLLLSKQRGGKRKR